MKIIREHGEVLLAKSQKPEMKVKKSQSLEKIKQVVALQCGICLSEMQITKKLNNLKTRLKEKIDRNKTGNKPIILNEADQILSELLFAQDNPSISRLKCKCYIYIQIYS